MTIPPEYKMVSFDVVSLFTSVPLDETIDIINVFMIRRK